MSSEQFCLRWNNFETNIASFLDILRSGQDFVDVTITCENTNFKAHKLILSACSPYFKGIFQEIPCQHPVIILKEVRPIEMDAILRYMYTGETHVTEEGLQSFLHTAGLLQVVGLAHCAAFASAPVTTPGSSTLIQTKNNNSAKSSHLTPPKKRSLSDTFYHVDKAAEDTPTPSANQDALSGSTSDNSSVQESNGSEKCLTKLSTTDPCPILSKQLLLPKKRKLERVLDQNKNIELCSEHSDSSEGELSVKREVPSNDPDKCHSDHYDGENEQDLDDNDEESVEQDGCILEPEVGLSVKEEPSDSEDSLPNGDILMQRLQCSAGNEGRVSEDNRILRVPNPDVSIFSQRLTNQSTCSNFKDIAVLQSNFNDAERLTLAPNVDIFLKNSNSREHLLARLGRINLFKKRKSAGAGSGSARNSSNSSSTSGATSGEDLKLHLTNLPCPHCTQLYNNLSALKYHVRLMHSDLENKLFCYLCPMSFLERDYFKLHLWEAHHARF